MVLSPGKQGDHHVADAEQGERNKREAGGVPEFEQTITDADGNNKDREIEEV